MGRAAKTLLLERFVVSLLNILFFVFCVFGENFFICKTHKHVYHTCDTRDTKKTRERERERERKTEDECGVSVECVSFFQREDEKEEEEET